VSKQGTFTHFFLASASMLGLTWSVAFAQAPAAPAPEPAITQSLENANLQWGPCPKFIGKGCEIAVLHGDPAKPNADIFFRVPPNFAVPAHWHTSPERMVLVTGEMHVTYERQEPMVLKPGMYAYGPAKLPHSAKCASTEPCVLFIAFELPIDTIPVGKPAQ
jgi:mannose-6-phosphate isomerase-like protein (cupin superfamily)